VARRAAHAGGPQIALQVLIYPVTDCDPDALSYADPANQLLLTAESMRWFWDQYARTPPRALTPTPRRCGRRSCSACPLPS
jgi:acetyl esterase